MKIHRVSRSPFEGAAAYSVSVNRFEICTVSE